MAVSPIRIYWGSALCSLGLLRWLATRRCLATSGSITTFTNGSHMKALVILLLSMTSIVEANDVAPAFNAIWIEAVMPELVGVQFKSSDGAPMRAIA